MFSLKFEIFPEKETTIQEAISEEIFYEAMDLAKKLGSTMVSVVLAYQNSNLKQNLTPEEYVLELKYLVDMGLICLVFDSTPRRERADIYIYFCH